MSNETRHFSPSPQSEVKASGAETLTTAEFAKLLPAIGKNISVFYILDMTRHPNQGYGIEARPLVPIVDRDFQSIDWYFLKPNRLTTDVRVGTQYYYRNCEDVKRTVYAPKLSERGKNLGVPAAGLMADFASRHGVVLDRVFLQDTFSFYHPGDDVILRRLQRLEEIASMTGEYKCGDYKEQLELDKTIAETRNTASSLSRLGWVEYDSWTDDGGFYQAGFAYRPTHEGQLALTELLTVIEGIRIQDPNTLQKRRTLADAIKLDTNKLVGLTALIEADRQRQFN